mmetsp:Transcript_116658/g.201531  ORF Transcript_116658/g.201531 Transcript_116658/m.201531 type:complete len:201 (+) Transcript_116658:1358-1960(+)
MYPSSMPYSHGVLEPFTRQPLSMHRRVPASVSGALHRLRILFWPDGLNAAPISMNSIFFGVFPSVSLHSETGPSESNPQRTRTTSGSGATKYSFRSVWKRCSGWSSGKPSGSLSAISTPSAALTPAAMRTPTQKRMSGYLNLFKNLKRGPAKKTSKARSSVVASAEIPRTLRKTLRVPPKQQPGEPHDPGAGAPPQQQQR